MLLLRNNRCRYACECMLMKLSEFINGKFCAPIKHGKVDQKSNLRHRQTKVLACSSDWWWKAENEFSMFARPMIRKKRRAIQTVHDKFLHLAVSKHAPHTTLELENWQCGWADEFHEILRFTTSKSCRASLFFRLRAGKMEIRKTVCQCGWRRSSVNLIFALLNWPALWADQRWEENR